MQKETTDASTGKINLLLFFLHEDERHRLRFPSTLESIGDYKMLRLEKVITI